MMTPTELIAKRKYKGRHPKPKSERPLTPVQLRFAQEVIGNPLQSHKAAAIKAGYKSTTAAKVAANLLKDPRVKKMVDKAKDKTEKDFEVSREQIIQELYKVAFTQLDDAISIDENGEIQVKKGAAVEVSYETNNRGVKTKKAKTAKLSDKVSALVQLGKHLGMFKEQLEVSGNLSILDLVTKSMEKKDEKPVD